MTNNDVYLSKQTVVVLLALALMMGTERACVRRKAARLDAVDKEIKAAQASLDSITALQDSACALRDMYHDMYHDMYWTLNAAIDLREKSAVCARKDAECFRIADSLYKYCDEVSKQFFAKDSARWRLDTLLQKRDRILNSR